MTSHLKKLDTSKEQSVILPSVAPLVHATKKEINERLLLPKDQWIDMADDTVFDDVINSLRISKPNS